MTGAELVAGSIAELSTGLTSASPASTHGRLIVSGLGVASQGMDGIIVGMVGGMGPMIELIERYEAWANLPQYSDSTEQAGGRKTKWYWRPGCELLVYLAIIAPLSCMTASMLGFVLASLEGWSADTGFWFMMSNIAALPNPFVDEEPDSDEGRLVEYLLSLYAMMHTSCFVGGAAMLTYVVDLPHKYDLHSGSRVWFLVVAVFPLFMLAVASVFAVMMTLCEGWEWWTSFLWVNR